MEKEKLLVTSFFLANSADTAITAAALNLTDLQEVGLYGQQAVTNNEFRQAVILKTAVTATLIGAYVLAKQKSPESEICRRLEFVLEKTLHGGNLIVWSTVAWNLYIFIPEILQRLKYP